MASLVLSPATVGAQTNYQSYPVGGRAAGMGGAYTALANDAPGAYYNPAGIAWAEGDSLSLSASLYGMVGGSETSALGAGQDYTYSAVNLVPSATSSVAHLGHGTPERPSRWVFGFNVFAPQNFTLNQPTTVNHGATTLFNTLEESTLLLGPTLAWRISDRVSVGLSVHGVYHSLTVGQDFTDTVPVGTGAVMDFVQVTSNLSQTDLGLLVMAGVRVRLDDNVWLGASLRTPSVAVYGRGKSFTRTVAAATTAGVAPQLTVNADAVDTLDILPLRAALGMAWARPGRFTLSLDFTLYAPVAYNNVTSVTNPTLNSRITHDTVLDLAVGAEIPLTPTVPLLMGLFTDLSAAPAPTPTGNGEDQVNLLGATLGAGWKGAHTATTLAVIAAWGWTQDLGFDVTAGSYQAFVTHGTQWRVYLNYAGTYTF